MDGCSSVCNLLGVLSDIAIKADGERENHGLFHRYIKGILGIYWRKRRSVTLAFVYRSIVMLLFPGKRRTEKVILAVSFGPDFFL